MTDRQDGILWRLARLHPAWNCVLIMTSLLLPIATFAYIDYVGSPATLLEGLGGLLLMVLANLCLPLPLLYIYGTIVLLSGRYHSRGDRRFRESTVAVVFLAAVIVALLPLVWLIGSMAEDKGVGPVVLVLTLGVGAWVAFKHLLTRAAWELVDAERSGDIWQRRNITWLSLLLWPLGFYWIQARIRRLVREFETGQFLRLPLEAVGFSDEGLDKFIELTKRVRPEHAAAYAEDFARRAGGSITGKCKSATGLAWDLKIDRRPLRLVFDNDPPLFTLHTESDPEDGVLYTTIKRVEESVSPAPKPGGPKRGRTVSRSRRGDA